MHGFHGNHSLSETELVVTTKVTDSQCIYHLILYIWIFSYPAECDLGWFGVNCNKSCINGFYGKLCKTSCECETSMCNKTTGCPTLYKLKNSQGKSFQITLVVYISLYNTYIHGKRPTLTLLVFMHVWFLSWY